MEYSGGWFVLTIHCAAFSRFVRCRQKVTPLEVVQASLCSFLRVSEGTACRFKP